MENIFIRLCINGFGLVGFCVLITLLLINLFVRSYFSLTNNFSKEQKQFLFQKRLDSIISILVSMKRKLNYTSPCKKRDLNLQERDLENFPIQKPLKHASLQAKFLLGR